jgi:site-specific recombinase XerD
MSEQVIKSKRFHRQDHGWFAARPHSYSELLKNPLVAPWIKRYREGESQESYARALQKLLNITGKTVDEFEALSAEEAKRELLEAADKIRKHGMYAEARKVVIAAKGFMEQHKKPIELDRLEKKKYYAAPRKKIAYEIIPNREQVYKMADGSLTLKASLRNRAMILCLFQSGVRENCLCRWTYGMFKDQLYPDVKVPVKLIITAEMDTKLQSYDLGYYITFLQRDAAEGLKAYLDYRMQRGWQPKDDDLVFVTESTASQGEPIKPQNVWEVIKQPQVARAAGLDPRSIWTRLLRKAFQKVLNQSDLDEDTKESLMGHKLPGSRGNYFDFHDHQEIAAKYMRCQYDRTPAGGLDEATKRTMIASLSVQYELRTGHQMPADKAQQLEALLTRQADSSDDHLKRMILNLMTEESETTSRTAARKRRIKNRTAHNGGTRLHAPYETRIVGERELVPLLNEGYDLVKELADGRVIVRKPLDEE